LWGIRARVENESRGKLDEKEELKKEIKAEVCK
jgi:hypothetical protein